MSTRTNVVLLQFFAVACLFASVKCQLCEVNRYSYHAPITCTNVTGKFPELPKASASLRCYDCNVPTLDENTIANFKGDTFNLSYSHVRNITSTAFKNFDNSTHKYLFEGNEIVYVAPGIFSGFSSIDDIVFRNNSISALPDGMFENTSVTVLDLSCNKLSKINFRGLKVALLNLSFNEITSLDENTFDGVTFWTGRRWITKAQQINLSYNLIRKIDRNVFKANSNTLYVLSFKNNKLTKIENATFIQLNNLQTLSLEENYISELDSGSFKGLGKLNILSLKDNKIEKLPQSLFADLQTLEILDLSLNSLTALSTNTFSGLIHLSKLNISHNNLKVLEDAHIFPLGRLMTLDISDTKLRSLSLAAMLEHHFRLRVLVINDNFWTCKQLVEMYRLLTGRMGGFESPARHYDVPNLHGIACSRTELDPHDDDMTFDDFLGIISNDRVFEDLFDNRINEDFSDLLGVKDVIVAVKSVRGVYNMLLAIVILLTVLVVQCTVRCAFQYLYRRNTVASDKYCLSYSPNQDNVELI